MKGNLKRDQHLVLSPFPFTTCARLLNFLLTTPINTVQKKSPKSPAYPSVLGFSAVLWSLRLWYFTWYRVLSNSDQNREILIIALKPPICSDLLTSWGGVGNNKPLISIYGALSLQWGHIFLKPSRVFSFLFFSSSFFFSLYQWGYWLLLC
jgi:hypothetical protein